MKIMKTNIEPTNEATPSEIVLRLDSFEKEFGIVTKNNAVYMDKDDTLNFAKKLIKFLVDNIWGIDEVDEFFDFIDQLDRELSRKLHL